MHSSFPEQPAVGVESTWRATPRRSKWRHARWLQDSGRLGHRALGGEAEAASCVAPPQPGSAVWPDQRSASELTAVAPAPLSLTRALPLTGRRTTGADDLRLHVVVAWSTPC